MASKVINTLISILKLCVCSIHEGMYAFRVMS